MRDPFPSENGIGVVDIEFDSLLVSSLVIERFFCRFFNIIPTLESHEYWKEVWIRFDKLEKR